MNEIASHGTVGDIIGCGLAFSPSNTKYCSVFFTYNGCEIGRVRSSYTDGGLFPSITFTSSMDKVSVRMMETFKPKHPQVVGFIYCKIARSIMPCMLCMLNFPCLLHPNLMLYNYYGAVEP